MFVGGFEDKFPGKCDGRSISMIDCRKFDDPRQRQKLEETHWSDGMHRFSSSKKRRDHDMQEHAIGQLRTPSYGRTR